MRSIVKAGFLFKFLISQSPAALVFDETDDLEVLIRIIDNMTMLNACPEAHAFATLTQWKGGILGVLLPEPPSDRLAKELGRPVSPKRQVKFYFL